ncbi:MAG: ABC transporter substrate-binding protein [Methylovulum sp.]|nr:ABC transporter substrate-binding protein [Methylovulum sp.]
MNIKHVSLLVLMAVFLSILPITRSFADDLLPPQQAIYKASAELQIRLQQKGFTKDFAKITDYVSEVIDPHTDFERISALVLGKLWKTATPNEREHFKQEFKTLLIRTYSRAFIEFKEWTVRFLPLEMAANADKVIVKTQVLQPGIQPIAVDYRMALHDNQWKAYDIMIEGVSLVTNYRSTFTNEVQAKGSLTAVIDSLAKRNLDAFAVKKK